MRKVCVLFCLVLFSITIPLSLWAKEKKLQDVNMVIGFIPHVQFAPLYVGMEEKIFEKHGINLNIEYGFGIDAFSLILAGKVDCTLSDSDQLIVAREKGLPLKSFFQYYQDYPVSIVTLGKGKSPSDLAGKKIGVPQLFGTSYIGTKVFLQKHGLEGKVELVKVGYTQIASLMGGKVDAVTCFYNNEPIKLRNEGTEITEWKVKDFSSLTGASFISSDKILKKDKKKMRAFILALEESIRWTVSNQEKALEISYAHIGTLQDEQKDFWKQVLNKTCELFASPGGFGDMDKRRYEETINTLYAIGLINKKVNLKDILYK